MVLEGAVTEMPDRGAVFWGAVTETPDRGAVRWGAVTDTGAVRLVPVTRMGGAARRRHGDLLVGVAVGAGGIFIRVV